jgi:hypothetical protein
MDATTKILAWLAISQVAAAAGWLSFRYLKRYQARQATQRVSQALAVSHAVFTALEHVPNGLISRNLRRGLVMLLSHHLENLRVTNPHHPHLHDLENRLTQLNRMPSGFQRINLRSKDARRHASVAFEQLAKILKDSLNQHIIDAKDGALAHAAALFSAQQMAVETARQAAIDAENVRAYGQALNYARQALALCSRLPPLVGAALAESISQDVERLEAMSGRMARI